jgi:aspartate/tyrosine/aromatic aminotransferase
MHACAHNPTGSDLSVDQWKVIRDIFLEKNHVCFLDMAYQVKNPFAILFSFIK